ncbi:hypothetical protein CSUI_001177 [Cystoisospora suis]|uniref:Uncharacterized protein n=1 Tax=Cystoisospora suis TaxID=483139 RepID=A0A2C6LD73_9APIC|nr:hypothetical protein CSUI_001177 [Cystoisospora suis]
MRLLIPSPCPPFRSRAVDNALYQFTRLNFLPSFCLSGVPLSEETISLLVPVYKVIVYLLVSLASAFRLLSAVKSEYCLSPYASGQPTTTTTTTLFPFLLFVSAEWRFLVAVTTDTVRSACLMAEGGAELAPAVTLRDGHRGGGRDGDKGNCAYVCCMSTRSRASGIRSQGEKYLIDEGRGTREEPSEVACPAYRRGSRSATDRCCHGSCFHSTKSYSTDCTSGGRRRRRGQLQAFSDRSTSVLSREELRTNQQSHRWETAALETTFKFARGPHVQCYPFSSCPLFSSHLSRTPPDSSSLFHRPQITRRAGFFPGSSQENSHYMALCAFSRSPPFSARGIPSSSGNIWNLCSEDDTRRSRTSRRRKKRSSSFSSLIHPSDDSDFVSMVPPSLGPEWQQGSVGEGGGVRGRKDHLCFFSEVEEREEEANRRGTGRAAALWEGKEETAGPHRRRYRYRRKNLSKCQVPCDFFIGEKQTERNSDISLPENEKGDSGTPGEPSTSERSDFSSVYVSDGGDGKGRKATAGPLKQHRQMIFSKSVKFRGHHRRLCDGEGVVHLKCPIRDGLNLGEGSLLLGSMSNTIISEHVKGKICVREDAFDGDEKLCCSSFSPLSPSALCSVSSSSSLGLFPVGGKEERSSSNEGRSSNDHRSTTNSHSEGTHFLFHIHRDTASSSRRSRAASRSSTLSKALSRCNSQTVFFPSAVSNNPSGEEKKEWHEKDARESYSSGSIHHGMRSPPDTKTDNFRKNNENGHTVSNGPRLRRAQYSSSSPLYASTRRELYNVKIGEGRFLAELVGACIFMRHGARTPKENLADSSSSSSSSSASSGSQESAPTSAMGVGVGSHPGEKNMFGTTSVHSAQAEKRGKQTTGKVLNGEEDPTKVGQEEEEDAQEKQGRTGGENIIEQGEGSSDRTRGETDSTRTSPINSKVKVSCLLGEGLSTASVPATEMAVGMKKGAREPAEQGEERSVAYGVTPERNALEEGRPTEEERKRKANEILSGRVDVGHGQREGCFHHSVSPPKDSSVPAPTPSCSHVVDDAEGESLSLTSSMTKGDSIGIHTSHQTTSIGHPPGRMTTTPIQEHGVVAKRVGKSMTAPSVYSESLPSPFPSPPAAVGCLVWVPSHVLWDANSARRHPNYFRSSSSYKDMLLDIACPQNSKNVVAEDGEHPAVSSSWLLLTSTSRKIGGTGELEEKNHGGNDPSPPHVAAPDFLGEEGMKGDPFSCAGSRRNSNTKSGLPSLRKKTLSEEIGRGRETQRHTDEEKGPEYLSGCKGRVRSGPSDAREDQFRAYPLFPRKRHLDSSSSIDNSGSRSSTLKMISLPSSSFSRFLQKAQGEDTRTPSFVSSSGVSNSSFLHHSRHTSSSPLTSQITAAASSVSTSAVPSETDFVSLASDGSNSSRAGTAGYGTVGRGGGSLLEFSLSSVRRSREGEETEGFMSPYASTGRCATEEGCQRHGISSSKSTGASVEATGVNRDDPDSTSEAGEKVSKETHERAAEERRADGDKKTTLGLDCAVMEVEKEESEKEVGGHQPKALDEGGDNHSGSSHAVLSSSVSTYGLPASDVESCRILREGSGTAGGLGVDGSGRLVSLKKTDDFDRCRGGDVTRLYCRGDSRECESPASVSTAALTTSRGSGFSSSSSDGSASRPSIQQRTPDVAGGGGEDLPEEPVMIKERLRCSGSVYTDRGDASLRITQEGEKGGGDGEDEGFCPPQAGQSPFVTFGPAFAPASVSPVPTALDRPNSPSHSSTSSSSSVPFSLSPLSSSVHTAGVSEGIPLLEGTTPSLKGRVSSLVASACQYSSSSADGGSKETPSAVADRANVFSRGRAASTLSPSGCDLLDDYQQHGSVVKKLEVAMDKFVTSSSCSSSSSVGVSSTPSSCYSPSSFFSSSSSSTPSSVVRRLRCGVCGTFSSTPLLGGLSLGVTRAPEKSASTSTVTSSFSPLSTHTASSSSSQVMHPPFLSNPGVAGVSPWPFSCAPGLLTKAGWQQAACVGCSLRTLQRVILRNVVLRDRLVVLTRQKHRHHRHHRPCARHTSSSPQHGLPPAKAGSFPSSAAASLTRGTRPFSSHDAVANLEKNKVKVDKGLEPSSDGGADEKFLRHVEVPHEERTDRRDSCHAQSDVGYGTCTGNSEDSNSCPGGAQTTQKGGGRRLEEKAATRRGLTRKNENEGETCHLMLDPSRGGEGGSSRERRCSHPFSLSSVFSSQQHSGGSGRAAGGYSHYRYASVSDSPSVSASRSGITKTVSLCSSPSSPTSCLSASLSCPVVSFASLLSPPSGFPSPSCDPFSIAPCVRGTVQDLEPNTKAVPFSVTTSPSSSSFASSSYLFSRPTRSFRSRGLLDGAGHCLHACRMPGEKQGGGGGVVHDPSSSQNSRFVRGSQILHSSNDRETSPLQVNANSEKKEPAPFSFLQKDSGVKYPSFGREVDGERGAPKVPLSSVSSSSTIHSGEGDEETHHAAEHALAKGLEEGCQNSRSLILSETGYEEREGHCPSVDDSSTRLPVRTAPQRAEQDMRKDDEEERMMLMAGEGAERPLHYRPEPRDSNYVNQDTISPEQVASSSVTSASGSCRHDSEQHHLQRCAEQSLLCPLEERAYQGGGSPSHLLPSSLATSSSSSFAPSIRNRRAGLLLCSTESLRCQQTAEGVLAGILHGPSILRRMQHHCCACSCSMDSPPGSMVEYQDDDGDISKDCTIELEERALIAGSNHGENLAQKKIARSGGKEPKQTGQKADQQHEEEATVQEDHSCLSSAHKDITSTTHSVFPQQHDGEVEGSRGGVDGVSSSSGCLYREKSFSTHESMAPGLTVSDEAIPPMESPPCKTTIQESLSPSTSPCITEGGEEQKQVSLSDGLPRQDSQTPLKGPTPCVPRVGGLYGPLEKGETVLFPSVDDPLRSPSYQPPRTLSVPRGCGSSSGVSSEFEGRGCSVLSREWNKEVEEDGWSSPQQKPGDTKGYEGTESLSPSPVFRKSPSVAENSISSRAGKETSSPSSDVRKAFPCLHVAPSGSPLSFALKAKSPLVKLLKQRTLERSQCYRRVCEQLYGESELLRNLTGWHEKAGLKVMKKFVSAYGAYLFHGVAPPTLQSGSFFFAPAAAAAEAPTTAALAVFSSAGTTAVAMDRFPVSSVSNTSTPAETPVEGGTHKVLSSRLSLNRFLAEKSSDGMSTSSAFVSLRRPSAPIPLSLSLNTPGSGINGKARNRENDTGGMSVIVTQGEEDGMIFDTSLDSSSSSSVSSCSSPLGHPSFDTSQPSSLLETTVSAGRPPPVACVSASMVSAKTIPRPAAGLVISSSKEETEGRVPAERNKEGSSGKNTGQSQGEETGKGSVAGGHTGGTLLFSSQTAVTSDRHAQPVNADGEVITSASLLQATFLGADIVTRLQFGLDEEVGWRAGGSSLLELAGRLEQMADWYASRFGEVEGGGCDDSGSKYLDEMRDGSIEHCSPFCCARERSKEDPGEDTVHSCVNACERGAETAPLRRVGTGCESSRETREKTEEESGEASREGREGSRMKGATDGRRQDERRRTREKTTTDGEHDVKRKGEGSVYEDEVQREGTKTGERGDSNEGRKHLEEEVPGYPSPPFPQLLQIFVTHQSALLALQAALGIHTEQLHVPQFGCYISAELLRLRPPSPGDASFRGPLSLFSHGEKLVHNTGTKPEEGPVSVHTGGRGGEAPGGDCNVPQPRKLRFGHHSDEASFLAARRSEGVEGEGRGLVYSATASSPPALPQRCSSSSAAHAESRRSQEDEGGEFGRGTETKARVFPSISTVEGPGGPTSLSSDSSRVSGSSFSLEGESEAKRLGTRQQGCRGREGPVTTSFLSPSNTNSSESAPPRQVPQLTTRTASDSKASSSSSSSRPYTSPHPRLEHVTPPKPKELRRRHPGFLVRWSINGCSPLVLPPHLRFSVRSSVREGEECLERRDDKEKTPCRRKDDEGNLDSGQSHLFDTCSDIELKEGLMKHPTVGEGKENNQDIVSRDGKAEEKGEKARALDCVQHERRSSLQDPDRVKPNQQQGERREAELLHMLAKALDGRGEKLRALQHAAAVAEYVAADAHVRSVLAQESTECNGSSNSLSEEGTGISSQTNFKKENAETGPGGFDVNNRGGQSLVNEVRLLSLPESPSSSSLLSPSRPKHPGVESPCTQSNTGEDTTLSFDATSTDSYSDVRSVTGKEDGGRQDTRRTNSSCSRRGSRSIASSRNESKRRGVCEDKFSSEAELRGLITQLLCGRRIPCFCLHCLNRARVGLAEDIDHVRDSKDSRGGAKEQGDDRISPPAWMRGEDKEISDSVVGGRRKACDVSTVDKVDEELVKIGGGKMEDKVEMPVFGEEKTGEERHEGDCSSELDKETSNITELDTLLRFIDARIDKYGVPLPVGEELERLQEIVHRDLRGGRGAGARSSGKTHGGSNSSKTKKEEK